MKVEVRKLRRDGSLRIGYQGDGTYHAGSGFWVVSTRWQAVHWNPGFVEMQIGDPCREFYRPGACLAILELGGEPATLKGYYVDLCAPVSVSQAGQVVYRDLVLDLFVDPSGRWRLLDTGEFVEWVRTQATPQEVAWAVAGLAEAFERWRHGQGRMVA